MKRSWMSFWMLTLLSSFAFGQKDSALKNNNKDTLRIGNMVIIRQGESKRTTIEEKKKTIKKHTPSRVTTNWLVIDLGVDQFKDGTNYNSASIQDPLNGFAPGANEDWFDLRNGKSIHFNLWLFMQRTNLVRHVLNLKYGLGIEFHNFRFSAPVVFTSNPTKVLYDASTSYSKNKLGANYLTIPLMLNVRLFPESKRKGLGFSAGISTGYLFNSRQKTITAASGKTKTKDDFELRPWKFAYVGELQLGPIQLYGSLADRSMFKKGLDLTPYNVGFRISSF